MKIFGIGLMRTGTVSLAEALRLLGYKAAHEDELRAVMGNAGWLAGDFQTDWLKDYDAALDYPVPAYLELLDRRYPDSKFILTTRDIDSWLESSRKYLDKVPADDFRKVSRTAVHGMYNFNEAAWRETYHAHRTRVKEYFKSRPGDLLEMGISIGEGWDKLCPFLDKPVPQEPFPKVNTHLNYVFK